MKRWFLVLVFSMGWLGYPVAFAADDVADTRSYRRTPVVEADLFSGQPEKTAAVPDAPDYRSWHHRLYLESYLRYGHRDEAWDEMAIAALSMDADSMSGLSPSVVSDRLDVFDAVLAAGCTDPFIIYRRYRHYSRAERPDAMERRILSMQAATAMAASEYPAYLKTWSFLRAARRQPPSHGGLSITQRANMTTLLGAALDLVPMILKDPDIPREEVSDLGSYYAATYGRRYGDRDRGFEQFYAVLKDHYSADAPVLYLVRADFYTRRAWDARGTDFGFAVLEESWELYGDRINEALEALKTAWELDDQDPAVARRIQSIYAQRCSPEAEVWHQKVLALDPGNYGTRSIKLHFLLPQWCGSAEAMIALGRACYETQNWDTRLPFLLVNAHNKLAGSPQFRDRRGYFAQPEVWDDIRSVYETYLGMYPDKHWDRSRYAYYAYACGQWELAYEQILRLGDDLCKRAFGGTRSFENSLHAIQRRLGLIEVEEDLAETEILLAIGRGDLAAVQEWLADDGDVNASDDQGYSLLWQAVRAEQTDIVRLLVEAGADVNFRNRKDLHILFRAVDSRQLEILDILLEHGARPNTWNPDRTRNVLARAIQRRMPAMIELLIAHGANIESGDRRKNSALNKAADAGYPEMIELFVDYGANIETRNSWQYTPLMTAAAKQRRAAVETLIRLGAAVDAETTMKSTALFIASHRGYAEIIRVLLDAGASPDIVLNRDLTTPLMAAADGGHLEAVQLLLERGAKVDVREREGHTAAEIATLRGHGDIARLIEERATWGENGDRENGDRENGDRENGDR